MSCAYCNQQTLQQKWEKGQKCQRYQSVASAIVNDTTHLARKKLFWSNMQWAAVPQQPWRQRCVCHASVPWGHRAEAGHSSTGAWRPAGPVHACGYSWAWWERRTAEETTAQSHKWLHRSIWILSVYYRHDELQQTFTMHGHSNVCKCATTYSSSLMQFYWADFLPSSLCWWCTMDLPGKS